MSFLILILCSLLLSLQQNVFKPVRNHCVMSFCIMFRVVALNVMHFLLVKLYYHWTEKDFGNFLCRIDIFFFQMDKENVCQESY